ncbi:hypothetical protein [Polymorphobacter multimanifer]|nr:hypothetical protein [Polymorphobacter multimanifer]
MNEMRVIDVPLNPFATARLAAASSAGAAMRTADGLAAPTACEYIIHTFMLRVAAIYTIRPTIIGGAKMLFR